MPVELWDNAHAFPLAPSGGLFVLIVGVAILLGSLIGRARQILLYIGLGAAAVATAMFAVQLTAGLPPPSLFAISALVVAVVLEMLAFAWLMPRLRGSERPTAYASLVIVGAHFLLMVPAFGPLIFILGLLCLLNASIGMISQAIPLSSTWGVDGLIKITIGALMLRMSLAFA
jgi:hypothetical protein